MADTTIAGRAERQAGEYDGDAETLKRQIDVFVQQYEGYRKKNSVGDKALVYGGIVLSTVVPLSVVFKTPVVGAVLGAIVAVMIAVQSAQALGAKAAFYELVTVQGKNLMDRLSFGTVSDREFSTILKEFLALRMNAVENRPRGQGMAVVSAQSLGRDLEKVK